MKTSNMRFVPIFFRLVKTNLIIVRPQLGGKFLNVAVRTLSQLYISGYVLPMLGFADNFGLMLYAGIIGSIGLFECSSHIPGMLVDIVGDCSISYYLTLPLRPWVVLLSIACSYALISLFLSVVILFCGKVLLFNMIDFSAIAWGRLATVLLLANLFCGMVTIALLGYVRTALDVPSIWDRFIIPMWLFGGFFFTWHTMYKASPLAGYAMLFNPMMYAMEGMRVAIIGQSGYLPWPLCVGGLSVGIIVCWLFGYHGMKKRLDFV